MSKLRYAIVGMIVAGLAVSVFSTPSTQIWIPSTDVQAFLKPHLGWDVYLATKKINDSTLQKTVSNGGVTVGVLPFSKVGLEIGIDYRDIGGDHTYPLYFNAKVGIPEDSLFPYQPAIAVGAYDFSFSVDAQRYNLVYGLIAKNIWKLGRFSVGGFKGAVGADPKETFYVASDPEAKPEDVGLLASWDRTISELSDKLWLSVDFQSGRSGYGAVSFAGAWSFAPNVSAILGYDYFIDNKGLKPTVTLQFDTNVFP